MYEYKVKQLLRKLRIKFLLFIILSNILLAVWLINSRYQYSIYFKNGIPFIMDENFLQKQTINYKQYKEEHKIKTFHINLEFGRWDSKHDYKFFDYVLPGDHFAELSRTYKVCLATQSSLHKLDSLVEVAHHWNSSISVAVFVAGDEYQLCEVYVSYLRQCFPEIRERVSFHLAYSQEFQPTYKDTNFVFNHEWNCSHPRAALLELIQLRSNETVKWWTKALYPQNHLRNLARRNCQSPYVFLTDVDIIPSVGMAEYLDVFLRSEHCKKLCAYVIPVYELDEKTHFPQNKTDIIKMVKKNLARPFHQKVYKNAQNATDYGRWEKIKDKEDQNVHVSHAVKYHEWYEPFYVAADTVPAHDERFIGYGFTRNTQVYEMSVAGYEFLVLSPVFTCHWGFHTHKEDYTPWRKIQVSRNSKKLKPFKKEIADRYKK